MINLKKYFSVDEIQNDVEKTKQAGESWYTNIYIGSDVLQKLIDKNKISGVVSDKTNIIVGEFHNTTKMYFSTVDFENFAETAREIFPKLNYPVSAEIYADSRNIEQVNIVQKYLEELGFKYHATQYRLTRLSKTNFYNEIDSKWYADKCDCEEIYQMLMDTFDRRCDQIPDIDELLERADKHEILKINSGDKIASAIIFTRKPSIAEWVFWLTRPEYRTGMYGLHLRKAYLQLTSNVRRQITYVREERMKRFHEEVEGFIADGFENRIFVLDK